MPKAVDRREVMALREAGAQLVEVLSREEYELEYLPGAVSLPLRELGGRARVILDLSRPVVVYCHNHQ
ncbi:hypothetical protein Tter_2083 [Thermobaculum terrenum ATCC BAA-798]|uniref:Rhodanese domain-containing protein n=2 Tax=Thermobaculum TaxID=262406 RepID=D1CGW5_THET1|nr:hypothetical protein Tter_2083 [Thermobaculum terrenum ATCC BAA-798]